MKNQTQIPVGQVGKDAFPGFIVRDADDKVHRFKTRRAAEAFVVGPVFLKPGGLHKELLSAAVHLLDNAEEHIARLAEDDGWVVTKKDFEELQRCVQAVRKEK